MKKKIRETKEVLGPAPLVKKRFLERPSHLGEMLKKACARFPQKEALIFGDQRLTYRELVASSDALSFTFQRRYQIAKGDRIALLLPNSIDYAICYLASAQIGAISVTLNTRCRSRELQFMIANADPKLLITCGEFFPEVEPFALSCFDPGNIILTSREGRAPSLSGLIRDGIGGKPQFPSVKEEDISGLMYTSGTTGKPKGAMISHGNIIANSIALSSAYFCREDDVDLILAPLFHATGLHGQLLRSIYMGSTCVILREFKAEQTLKTIQKERVTVCVAVPTIFWLMMIHPDFRAYDLTSLERMIYGGAPASHNFIQHVSQKFPRARQINAFGLTECTSVATTLPPQDAVRKLGSIGLPASFTEIEIVDQQGRRVLPNGVGEILIRSPMVCKGYWRDSKATEATFQEGWLHTGDLGKVDDEGFIYLMDRKKDMIIRGGENIYCLEIENILYSHPKILEAAVVGVPDEIFGEQVKACIVLKTGESASVEEIRSHCEKHLADYKIPKYIDFVSSLPRNPGGKVIKAELGKRKSEVRESAP